MGRSKLLVLLDRGTDPSRNVPLEDRIFERVERREIPDVLRFWKNDECLIRGSVKSPKHGWYDEQLATKLKIQVIERRTGGGVVYNDLGNLNWSYFTHGSGAFRSPVSLFEKASAPVVNALRGSGFDAMYSSPNRIDVAGRKVSGMAARSTRKANLVHGTLLVDTNLERLNALCVPPPGCPPVSNLREFIADISEGAIEEAIIAQSAQTGFEIELVSEL